MLGRGKDKKSWEETRGREVSPKWPAKMKTEAALRKIDEFITKHHPKQTFTFFPIDSGCLVAILVARHPIQGTGASAELGLLYCSNLGEDLNDRSV